MDEYPVLEECPKCGLVTYSSMIKEDCRLHEQYGYRLQPAHDTPQIIWNGFISRFSYYLLGVVSTFILIRLTGATP